MAAPPSEPAQPPPLPSFNGISRSFGAVAALRDLRLAPYPGEAHALVGENGAGKSTLVKILAGVHSLVKIAYRNDDDRKSFQETQGLLNFALWSPADLGYLAAYAGAALASGQITGAQGEKFKAGKLGEYTIGANGVIVLGPPMVVDATNIDKFNF